MTLANDDILITLYDLKRLFLYSLPLLRRIALYTFICAFVFFLFKKPQYLARATFKQMNKQTDIPLIGSPLLKLKEFSPFEQNSPIFSVMHSDLVLKDVVEKLGMQINCERGVSSLLKRAWTNIRNELGLELAYPDPFVFRNASFLGDKPLYFYLRPINSEHFEILNLSKKQIAIGQLGRPVDLPECSFTLAAFPRKYACNYTYAFKVSPWFGIVASIRQAFELRRFKLDKNVYTLYFQNHDRMQSADFLNQVMASYEEYFHRENEQICQAQVRYLEKRKADLTKEFTVALQEHCRYLQENIDAIGYMGYEQERCAFTGLHNTFNSKLFDIDIELKRMQSLHNPHIVIEEKDMTALTLPAAKDLYLHCLEKKNRFESEIKEHLLLQKRLNDPQFEISSLSRLLGDAVSAGLVQAASTVALKLKDGENRTVREQQRLQEELDTQKRFLHQHLTHLVDLQQTQLGIISDKIQTLQQQTINLLQGEKQLIEQKVAEIKEKIATLPEKWQRENLLLLKKEMGAHMLTAMTQLFESKNLNQKLYQASSSHLDLSIPPLRPRSPFLLVYS